MTPHGKGRNRHIRHAAAVSLVATAGILGTYLGSPRIPQAYARPGAPFEAMFAGSDRPGLDALRAALPGNRLLSGPSRAIRPTSELPYDFTCDVSVDDSVGLHDAVRASTDDSVICITAETLNLSEQLVIDDTSLVIIGAAGDDSTTNVTLIADDTRHIYATFDDTYSGLLLANITFTGGSVDDSGGSIFIDGAADSANGTGLYLIDDSFIGNSAGGSGGAIYARDIKEFQAGTDNYSSNGRVVFESNRADGDGGALFLHNPESAVFYGSRFALNYAGGSGGAVATHHENGLSLIAPVNSAFIDDSAAVTGGAIAITGSNHNVFMYAGSVREEPTIFSGNSAPEGGAVWMSETGSGAVALWALGGLQMVNNMATGGDGGAVLLSNDDSGGIPIPLPGPFGYTWGFLSFGLGYYGYYNAGIPQFVGNSSTGDGGAVHVTGLADVGGQFLADYLTPYVTGTIFSGNIAGGSGGAMFVDGTALVRQSSFVGNTSLDSGGAIAVDDSTSLTSSFPYRGAFTYGAYFADNSVTAGAGGAIYVGEDAGDLVTSSSTFARNYAQAYGGAVFADDSVFLDNSTFTGNNTILGGGAIGAYGRVSVDFSTITDNSTDGVGGGIYGTTVTVTNSIVQRNQALGIVGGAPPADPNPQDVLAYNSVSSSFSLFTRSADVFARNVPWTPGSGTQFSDQVVVGALGDNGGFPVTDDTVIPTMLPLDGSPVINAADPSFVGSSTTYDERGPGFLRVVGSRADIGAVESAFAPPPAPTPASPPRDVSAVAGDAEVTVTWLPPSSSGSFPVTNYRAIASVEGQEPVAAQSCLAAAPEVTCTINQLVNGVTYTVRVQALTGAGWSALSQPSASVTPEAPVQRTIVISGTRERVDGRNTVVVKGTTTGLVGDTVNARVRLPGQSGYSDGSSRVVDAAGEFTWQRISRKKVYVYFVADDGSVRSNRVIVRR